MRRLAGVALALGIIVLPSINAGAAGIEVSVGEDQYTPRDVTVAAGDTVVWSYGGSNSHTVTADDGSFDSSPTCGQVLGQCMGASFSHQFNSPGTFGYHCRIVQTMVGTVTVEAASTTTTSRATSTSTTSTSTTVPTSETSTSLASDQPTITQAALPSLPGGRVVPKSIIRSGRTDDDVRPWVFLDVGIAGTTTIVGTVLVRRGRVPFG
jgi:plastocyanin